MAESLIDPMAGDFDPTAYTDSYRDALQEVIDVKIGKKETIERPPEEPIAPTIDLMAALRESVERARSSRKEGRKPATVTPIRAPKKAAPAAKKAAASSAKQAAGAAKGAAGKAAPVKKAAPKKTGKKAA
jgi:DNA end-binding protein Ku